MDSDLGELEVEFERIEEEKMMIMKTKQWHYIRISKDLQERL